MDNLISDKNPALVFVKPVCNNNDGTYEYDFYYSTTPDIVYGLDWNENNPSSVDADDLIPEKTTYNEIERMKTKLPFNVIQENSCYSMEYAMNGIVALAWINIDGLEDYPEDGRCVLMFGMGKDRVKSMIKSYLAD